MWSESQGGLHASQTGRNYLRFSATASACADWFSVWVIHESVFRLNLYMLKLCAEEMCSTYVFIECYISPSTILKKVCGLWVNENLTCKCRFLILFLYE